MKMRPVTLAVLLGFSVASPAIFAADSTTTKQLAPDPTPKTATPAAPAPLVASPRQMTGDQAVRARQEAYEADKEQLKKALGKGHDKAFYRQELEKMGYAITAVNSDDKDYLEYEVVKGGNSYEVQVDFKDGKSDKVDIANNVWKTKATKEALKNKGYQYVYPATTTADPHLFSDRTRGKAWLGEKAKIEKELGTGHDRNYYRSALEKMGYTVTSVNEREADELELEVVKGDTSYEVQIDFDKKTMKSTKVDVSTNYWESDATEKAKGEK